MKRRLLFLAVIAGCPSLRCPIRLRWGQIRVTCYGEVTLGDISILIDHLYISLAPLPLPCFEFND